MSKTIDQIMHDMKKERTSRTVNRGASYCELYPICPHCGHETKDYECYPSIDDEDWQNAECSKCEQKYEHKVEIRFSTQKIGMDT